MLCTLRAVLCRGRGTAAAISAWSDMTRGVEGNFQNMACCGVLEDWSREPLLWDSLVNPNQTLPCFECARKAIATFATGPRQNDTTLYEFRTYTIKPSMMAQMTKLTDEHFHIRMAHSEMVGYWSYEFGGLNKVLHIWKYDSFAHRSAVRSKLPHDKAWQEQYISKVLPMIEKQEIEITYLVPWCKIQKPEKEGVYELVSYQFKPGGPAVWGEAFKAAISTHVNSGYAKLVGVFNTEYGLLNQVHVLWWNEDADSRAAGRHFAHEDSRVVAAVRESVRFLDSQRNALLIPASFSPLK